jgi:hypothetical protein
MSRREHVPLSFAQERLWFLERLEPGQSAYHIPAPVRLRGPLEVWALERALGALLARHESLRTVLRAEQGQPVQQVLPPVPFVLPVRTLTAGAGRDATLQQEVAQESERPFDLARGPLLRASLLRLGSEEHVLLLTMHHIVSDGWSMGVLLRELTALYHAFSQGQPSLLLPLALQYADYAAWQRGWLTGAVLQEQLTYWKQQLTGAPTALELPTDRPRPAAQSH